MEPEDLLPYSKKPAISPYPQPVRFRGLCIWFVTRLIFYGKELLAPRPNPKLEDHPLSAVRDCCLHIWRPFLRSQLKDAPCRGKRNPLIQGIDVQKCTIF